MRRPAGEGRAEPGPDPLDRAERSIEDRLRRMSEAGELARLPGEGHPLPLEGEDGPQWAAFHLMKNNRLLPQWAEMRKEIDAENARLLRRLRHHLAWLDRRGAELRRLPAERIVEADRMTRAEDGRVRTRVAAEVHELNARIDRYNAAVPIASLQLPPVAVDRLFAAARASGRGPGDDLA